MGAVEHTLGRIPEGRRGILLPPQLPQHDAQGVACPGILDGVLDRAEHRLSLVQGLQGLDEVDATDTEGRLHIRQSELVTKQAVLQRLVGLWGLAEAGLEALDDLLGARGCHPTASCSASHCVTMCSTSATATGTATATCGLRPSPRRSASTGWQPTIRNRAGRTPSAFASMRARSGFV